MSDWDDIYQEAKDRGIDPLQVIDEMKAAVEQVRVDKDDGTLRTFGTGATRDTAQDKLDFEGFLSPLVLERFAEYMHENRKQSDGSFRDSDNWQKGIPRVEYAKSEWRHHFDFWKEHRGLRTDAGIERALCGIMFNVMGYLHEHLKEKMSFPSERRCACLEGKQKEGCQNAENTAVSESESECGDELPGELPSLRKAAMPYYRATMHKS